MGDQRLLRRGNGKGWENSGNLGHQKGASFSRWISASTTLFPQLRSTFRRLNTPQTRHLHENPGLASGGYGDVRLCALRSALISWAAAISDSRIKVGQRSSVLNAVIVTDSAAIIPPALTGEWYGHTLSPRQILRALERMLHYAQGLSCTAAAVRMYELPWMGDSSGNDAFPHRISGRAE